MIFRIHKKTDDADIFGHDQSFLHGFDYKDLAISLSLLPAIDYQAGKFCAWCPGRVFLCQTRRQIFTDHLAGGQREKTKDSLRLCVIHQDKGFRYPLLLLLAGQGLQKCS